MSSPDPLQRWWKPMTKEQAAHQLAQQGAYPPQQSLLHDPHDVMAYAQADPDEATGALLVLRCTTPGCTWTRSDLGPAYSALALYAAARTHTDYPRHQGPIEQPGADT